MIAGIPTFSAQAEITYAKDVAPILRKHCQECHRPGESVPMALMSYKDVRPWAKSIKKAVAERIMPPWHADPSIGKWKNDRSLTQDEIATLVGWVDGGTPLGDAADLPPALKFDKGWKIGQPDAVFTFDRELVLPATLKDEYRYVSMHTSFKEDRWVKGVECRPGNVEVVHHIIAFTKSAGLPRMGAGKGAKQGAFEGQGRGEGLLGSMSLLGGMAPGTPPFMMPKGQGILLPAGSDIIFQMHYHKEPGKEERDKSSVGLKFADYPVVKQYRADAIGNPLFTIPPGDENHEVNAMLLTQKDMELKTLMPHMHLRGKDMKVWVKFPDGREQDLLFVPKYDFNWQTIYELSEPLALPKGSRLYAKAHFDNSAKNPFNPNPNVAVHFGEPTTDEMMFAFISYTLPDENLQAKDPSFVLVGGSGQ